MLRQGGGEAETLAHNTLKLPRGSAQRTASPTRSAFSSGGGGCRPPVCLSRSRGPVAMLLWDFPQWLKEHDSSAVGHWTSAGGQFVFLPPPPPSPLPLPDTQDILSVHPPQVMRQTRSMFSVLKQVEGETDQVKILKGPGKVRVGAR